MAKIKCASPNCQCKKGFPTPAEVRELLQSLVHYFDGRDGPYSDEKRNIEDMLARLGRPRPG